tara:strand:+ start:217 stop:357 length:141 start_codon:yes stop_codon:yes gene_type:complete
MERPEVRIEDEIIGPDGEPQEADLNYLKRMLSQDQLEDLKAQGLID